MGKDQKIEKFINNQRAIYQDSKAMYESVHLISFAAALRYIKRGKELIKMSTINGYLQQSNKYHRLNKQNVPTL